MLHISKCKCQIAVACQHVIAASVEEGSCTAAVGCMSMAVDAATWHAQNPVLESPRSAESSLPEGKARHTLLIPHVPLIF
jgi:hypothetical protein